MMVWLTAAMLQRDSVRACVIDASTRAPLTGAAWIRIDEHTSTTFNAQRVDAMASSVVRSAGACSRLPSGTYLVRRVGFRESTARIARENGASTDILVPLTSVRGATVLAPMRVSSRADTTRSGSARDLARMTSSVSIDEARYSGAATTGQLLERVALAQTTSAHGETGLSLRAARREQVAITLDGLPLNDPATGTADIGDLPLVALGTVTARLGADPIGSGSGASGGVLALTGAAQRILAMRIGAFGQHSVEGAWSGAVGATTWHGAAMYRTAANAFPFENTASASDTVLRETRLNNDETTSSATVSVVGDDWQASALASTSERGMVGAANVRTYDADRANTMRALVRGQRAWRDMLFVVGAKRFALDYRDPSRTVLNSSAVVLATDADLSGVLRRHATSSPRIAWQAGTGADRLVANNSLTQSRARVFASADARWMSARERLSIGARADAVSGVGTQPSWSFAYEHQQSLTWTLAARAAQAFRAPTLYDLYFSSPQRLYVTTLRPERVIFDGELSSHVVRVIPHGVVDGDVAVIARKTHDAIVWFPGNFGWSPANVGAEHVRGVEARAHASYRALDVRAWSSVYDAMLNTGGLQIPTPYISRWSVGSQWLLHRGAWSASVLTREMGRRPYSAGPRDPAYELPAVSLIDLALAHPLSLRRITTGILARVTWSLDNATNTAWQSVRGFPSPGRRWAIACTLVQASEQ